MVNYKIIAFILLTFLFTAKSHSQGNVSIHVGPSIPVSDFGSGDLEDEDAGGAAVGLNVGLQYVYTLSESGIGLFGGIDFHYNGLKQSVKDDIEKAYKSMGISNPEITYYKFINVPVTAGFNFTHKLDEKVGLFANAGLALNFLKMTNMELKAYGQTATTEMDLASNIGFKLGGGILINNKLSISVDYLGLGKHSIKGKVKGSGLSEDIDAKGKVDLVDLTFGIKF